MNEKKIVWPEADMIGATLEWWEDETIHREDCVVRETNNGKEPCLVVLHKPTGKTSDEAGDAGRWRLDGTAF